MADPSEPASGLVLDASVAVKWHLKDEDHAAEAAVLLEDFGRGQLELVAPAQIRFEVPSAFSVATLGRNPRLSAAEGRAAIEEFLALRIQIVDDDALILAAYPLVHQYGCALYDALYLALSQRLRIPFVTADRKLHQRVKLLPFVVWITDYSRRTIS